MKFKQDPSVQIKDSITPPQIDVVKVATPAEQLERIRQRVQNIREEMGSRYLCHEQNRVRRIDTPEAAPPSTSKPNGRATIRRVIDRAIIDRVKIDRTIKS